jgi:hypothetical protein
LQLPSSVAGKASASLRSILSWRSILLWLALLARLFRLGRFFVVDAAASLDELLVKRVE